MHPWNTRPHSDALVELVRSEDMTLEAAKSLVVKVMSKSLDSTNLSAEKRTRLPAPTRSLQALHL